MLGDFQCTKPAGASLKFSIDCSPWLDGDTLATAVWTEASGGVTLVVQSNTSTIATVKVSGGTVGTRYNLLLTFTTVTSGETETEWLQMTVTA